MQAQILPKQKQEYTQSAVSFFLRACTSIVVDTGASRAEKVAKAIMVKLAKSMLGSGHRSCVGAW
jgi:hypothetical protein